MTKKAIWLGLTCMRLGQSAALQGGMKKTLAQPLGFGLNAGRSYVELGIAMDRSDPERVSRLNQKIQTIPAVRETDDQDPRHQTPVLNQLSGHMSISDCRKGLDLTLQVTEVRQGLM